MEAFLARVPIYRQMDAFLARVAIYRQMDAPFFAALCLAYDPLARVPGITLCGRAEWTRFREITAFVCLVLRATQGPVWFLKRIVAYRRMNAPLLASVRLAYNHEARIPGITA